MVETASSKPRPGELIIERHSEADALVLSLQGELDMATAPVLGLELRRVAASGPGRLVIDLGGLAFMDSSGLRELLLAQTSADSNGHELALRRGPYAVQRVMELTHTVDRFSFAN